jgi:hydroxypyruvate reductase
MRDRLTDLFNIGVAAADPFAAVQAALADVAAPTHVFALGKAAPRMAAAVAAQYPGLPCLLITTEQPDQPLPGARVMIGDHPVPTDRSAQAGEAALAWMGAIAGQTSPAPHVIALISGGGSALCVAPVEGVTLAQKAAVNEMLLGAGLDIVQMNIVRQALSRTKGGGLLRAAVPARVTSLVLSDVIGDDPRAVASGPTAGPIATRAEAERILRAAGLWKALPEAVQAALARTTPEAAPANQTPDVRMVGSNRLSVAAMAKAAPDAQRIDAPLDGDVAQAAAKVAALARSGPGLWVMGGETTVVLSGSGRGGRNQELALRVARALQDLTAPFAFLSGGTDGRDGPTDAAGGLVDQGTWARIGPQAQALLDNNDSYAALARAGDLVRMPATGTNVADLQILWVGDR